MGQTHVIIYLEFVADIELSCLLHAACSSTSLRLPLERGPGPELGEALIWEFHVALLGPNSQHNAKFGTVVGRRVGQGGSRL